MEIHGIQNSQNSLHIGGMLSSDFKITMVMSVVLTLLLSREIATNTRKATPWYFLLCTVDILARVYTLHPES